MLKLALKPGNRDIATCPTFWSIWAERAIGLGHGTTAS